MTGQRGTALLEYLGAVLGVALVIAALVSLRSFEAARRPPVDPIAPLRALVRPAPRTPVVRPAVRPARPVAPRPRRPRPPRAILEAPGWALGP